MELLLARAQLWEESAAKHVSMAPQLASLAGLATRWRRLELASWRCLLLKTAERHAAGLHAPRPSLQGCETHLRAPSAAESLPADAGPCCESRRLTLRRYGREHSSYLTCDDDLPLVAAGAHHSWFHLYRTLLLRDAALLDQSAATAVQQYLQTATLGEFAERLTMVKTFG